MSGRFPLRRVAPSIKTPSFRIDAPA
uniref:Uncharacterized protein n=1 Tax=Arundo donax TaxID=35708 RepID=A0A0A9DYR4_ARUDO